MFQARGVYCISKLSKEVAMHRRCASIMLALLLLTACGGAAASTSSQAQPESRGIMTSPASGEAAAGGGAAAPAAPAAAQSGAADKATGNTTGAASGAPPKQNAAQFGRKVILNASLTLQVKSADQTEQKVRELVERLGGYVVKSETSGDDERRSVRLTVKVPSPRFDEALNTLTSSQYAGKVLNRNVSGQDVTEEYVDLESRLRALKATESRLLDFLKDAKTVPEALQVNQQLTDLQTQIEQVTGRMKYLDQSTGFSTINLELQPDTVFALASPHGWQPGLTARNAWNQLLEFAQGIADVAIVMGIWSPVWALPLIAGLLFWRRSGRRIAPPQPTIQP